MVPLLINVTTILFMYFLLFTTTKYIKMSPHNRIHLFLFIFASSTLRYMGIYSKYVQNYNLICTNIGVKMLKILKTISTLKPSMVVLKNI